MPDDQELDLELTSPLVPLFVITNGRALPPDHEYEHTTLVMAAQDASTAARTLSPEAGQVMDWSPTAICPWPKWPGTRTCRWA